MHTYVIKRHGSNVYDAERVQVSKHGMSNITTRNGQFKNLHFNLENLGKQYSKIFQQIFELMVLWQR